MPALRLSAVFRNMSLSVPDAVGTRAMGLSSVCSSQNSHRGGLGVTWFGLSQ